MGRLATRLVAGCGAVAIGLAGCATAPPPERGTSALIAETLGEEQPAAEPGGPPPAVQQALLPPLQVTLPPPGPRRRETRFDVTVDGAPAREFFLSLVEDTPLNMVVHPGVTGEISLKLKDVSIDDVMTVARDVYGYEFRRTETGYQVYPATLQSRIFQVNYLNLDRAGSSETRVSSGQLVDRLADASDGGGQAATTLASSRIATTSHTNLWSELASSLRSLLGLPGSGPGPEGRTVVISPQAGVVTVRAMPDELRQVEAYLDTVQVNLHRQVILEAKILEVELGDGYRAGINWGALARPGNDLIVGGQTGGGTLPSEPGTNNAVDLFDPAGPSLTPFGGAGLDAEAFGGIFSAALRLDDFAAFIELLSTQGNVQVLSSPRVSTVNNQKAVIKVGSDEFFVTEVSSTTVTGTATTTTPEVTLTPFFSGIALDVTPQIDQQDRVTLHIHPTVSAVMDQQKAITVADQELNLPLALSTIRESDSIIRARSGQIVVIGGLIQDRTTETVAKTPLLGDIPYVGTLFRHTQQDSVRSELVILLRPIVVGAKTWAESLAEAAQRFDALDRGYHLGGRPSVFGTEAERQ